MYKTLSLGIMMALIVGACGQEEEPVDTKTEKKHSNGTMEAIEKKVDKAVKNVTDATAIAMKAAMLHTKVRAQLLDGVGADALRINVDVDGDRVVLMGTVTERANLELAKEMVEGMESVKTVESKLTLKAASSDEPGVMDTAKKELADAVLHTKVRMTLLDKIGSDALTIDIDVAEGKVVLSGAVASSKTIDAATQAIESMESVKGLENELRSKS